MRNAVIIQQSQGHGSRDSVVSAQGGAHCVDVISIHRQVQPFPLHILGAVRGFFAHHVQVSLEDHSRGMLIACGNLLDEDDIVGLILIVLQPPLPRKCHTPVADGLCVSGTMGNGTHLLKKAVYILGF